MFVHKKQRRSLDSKSRPVVFVGYCTNQKAYQLWDSKRGKLYTSRRVKFIEESFTFWKPLPIDRGPPIRHVSFDDDVAWIDSNVMEGRADVIDIGEDSPTDNDPSSDQTVETTILVKTIRLTAIPQPIRTTAIPQPIRTTAIPQAIIRSTPMSMTNHTTIIIRMITTVPR
jgi:hypothetical protein